MILKDKLRKRYLEYLTTPEWRDKKEQFRRWCERTGIPWECVGCGSGQVIVHHRTYVRLGEEDVRDLIPLCQECRQGVHRVHEAEKIPLSRTDLALREVRRWTEDEMARRMSPFGKVRKPVEICKSQESQEDRPDRIRRAKSIPISLMKNHDAVRGMARNGYTVTQIARAFKVSDRQVEVYLKQWT